MKRFSRSIQHNNRLIMQDYLCRHTDIDKDRFALMTYREVCKMYENIVWFDNMFRLYFGKQYFFVSNTKKVAKKFGDN